MTPTSAWLLKHMLHFESCLFADVSTGVAGCHVPHYTDAVRILSFNIQDPFLSPRISPHVIITPNAQRWVSRLHRP
jgi:hypothetical protein